MPRTKKPNLYFLNLSELPPWCDLGHGACLRSMHYKSSVYDVNIVMVVSLLLVLTFIMEASLQSCTLCKTARSPNPHQFPDYFWKDCSKAYHQRSKICCIVVYMFNQFCYEFVRLFLMINNLNCSNFKKHVSLTRYSCFTDFGSYKHLSLFLQRRIFSFSQFTRD